MVGVQMAGRTDARSELVVAPIPRYEPDPVAMTQTVAATGGADRRRRMPTPRLPGRPIADRVDPTARAFAVSALTMMLEVIDRRRPVAHLASLAAPHIVDQVTVWTARHPAAGSPTKIPGARPLVATLMRVHLQWSGPDAAEVSATYTRGERVRAIAARVQRVPVRVRPTVPGGPRTTEVRWMLVNVTTA